MDPKVIGPMDVALRLLVGQAITGAVNGTGLDLGSGFAPGAGGIPMLAEVPVTTIKLTVGNETYTFKLQDSADNSTWIDRSPVVTATNEGLTTDGGSGTIVVGGFIRQRYVRLAAPAPGGTSPSITVGDCFLQPRVNHVG